MVEIEVGNFGLISNPCDDQSSRQKGLLATSNLMKENL